MFQTLTIISVALLLTLTASVSAEEDRNLLSKLNSNVELTKVNNNKPVASVSGEPLKTAETRPGATGSDFTSSHTEQSYSSSASFESSGAGGPVSSSASGELNGNRGSVPVNPQAASSTSYQVSGENFAGASSEGQHQQNQQLQAQPQQHGSAEVYSSSAEDISSGAAAPSSAPSGYGRPDLNEVDFNRNNGYHAHGARALSHPYGSYDISGQTYDLQRNPEPAYDNGASGEFNSAQANVANEGGYGLNQDTSAYEDANSNEDEGSAYRTQEPEGSPVPLAGSGPENHQQQQVQQLQHQQNQQNLHQQQQQQQVQQQQQQSVPSADQGAQGPRKASTLATPGPVPDYGGFRPVIKSQTIPTPPIPGPQRPQHALAQGEPFRSVSINYEPPKSVYSYDGSPNTANTGSYNAKSFPVYGHGQQEPQPQVASPPNTHAGYNLDYASGKPYGGDLSIKPYSSDPNGNVKKIIPMTIGYDELVKPPTPSAAQYHTAGSPPSSPHHGSGYMVSHGPPQQNYEQGPPQGPYGQPPQGPPQGQQGPPQFNGGYGQPVTYQATPIGYAQPDSYEQQSGPIGYDQPPQQNAPHHHQQQHQHQHQHQQQQQPQQGPPMGSPINYGQQTPPVSYEQAEQIQVQPQQPQQGPPQNSPHPQPHHSHPYPPPPQASGQLSPPPQQQLQQTPPGYGPHSGPGPLLSGPPQFEAEQNYGPPQSAGPVNYEQSGPNEYQAAPPKQNYEQTTTFVESSGYPGNLGPSYGTIKDGPSPLTASISGPAPAPIEGYSGNIASENEYYPSSYDSIENSAGPSSYPSPMSGFNSQGGSYSSGGYSLPDDSYMQSLFGFPTYDVSGGKGNPYASGSNPIPSPASAGSHLSGGPSLGSSGLSGSSSGKPSPSSFLPSIKFTGNGIKLTGFGSSLTGGLGSLNQAIASTLGSGLSGVTGPGLGLSSGLTQALSSGLGSGLGSSLGSGPSMNGAALHGSGPSSGGLGRPLASFYNNLSGLGSPFGGLGGLNNYGTAASKLIPQAIRAPFRTMYRALMGNGAPNPMNG